MRKYARFWLPALMLAATSVLASCAGSGGGDKHEGSGSEDSIPKMEHDSVSTDVSEMLRENGDYSDERFIDAMVPHHQGAIDMAQVALVNAEHPEIRTLAGDVVSAQETEIAQLRAIKQEQFGISEVSTDMSAEDMEVMGMTMDPEELAKQEPFDKAFINNMLPHHESAIEMANVVLDQSENPEVREIAESIVGAQEREIEQMRLWREEWYPEG